MFRAPLRPRPSTLAIRGVIALALAAAALPDAARADAVQISDLTPSVCQVSRDPAATNCGTSEVTVGASSAGTVDERAVIRVDLRSALPADAQIVGAELRLWKTEGSEQPSLLWGHTFARGEDPAPAFADDPYFWTGETGGLDTPGGSSAPAGVDEDGAWTWPIGEPLERARALTNAPLALYLDLGASTDGATVAGSAASDATIRPQVRVWWTRDAGVRGAHEYTDVSETGRHRVAVNDATGNVLVEAHDLVGPDLGFVSRFANTLGTTSWRSEIDARILPNLVPGSVVFQSPTGESVSIDSTEPWAGWDETNELASESGLRFTDAPAHRVPYSAFSLNPSSDGPFGDVTYAYSIPSLFGASGIVTSGLPNRVQHWGGDDSSVPVSYGISRGDAGRVDLTSSNDGSVLYHGQLGPSGITRWTAASGSGGATLRYDDAGRLTRITDAGGSFSAYTYNASGQLETLRDADGTVLRFTYDGERRLVRMTSRTDDGGVTWMERAYPTAIDARCADEPDTERSVVGTSSSGGEIVWCIAGTGTVLSSQEDPPPFTPIGRNGCVGTECTTPPGEDPATTTDANDGTEPAPDTTGALADDQSAVASTEPTAARAAATTDGACGEPPRPEFSRVLGISDDRPPSHNLWGSRGYACLKPSIERRIEPYNITDLQGTDQQFRYDAAVAWVAAVKAAGATPMLSFFKCPGTVVDRDGKKALIQVVRDDQSPTGTSEVNCATPPTTEEYRAAVTRVLNDPNFAAVKVFAAFNEPNHTTFEGRIVSELGFNPTYLNQLAPPKTAANATNSKAFLTGTYYAALAELCAARTAEHGGPCTPLAGELADDSYDARKPGPQLDRYVAQMVKGMGDSAVGATWGLHYYKTLRERVKATKGSPAPRTCKRSMMSTKAAKGPQGSGCWVRLSQMIVGLRKALEKTGSTPSFWLSEGGVLHQFEKAKRTAWSRYPNAGFNGPAVSRTNSGRLYIAKAERDATRNTPQYRAMAAVFNERTAIASKWGVSIPHIFQYHWAWHDEDGNAWDSALFGPNRFTTAKTDKNGLFDRARPAFVALCEYAKPRDADGHVIDRGACWATDDNGESTGTN